jgi:hypothetical protein
MEANPSLRDEMHAIYDAVSRGDTDTLLAKLSTHDGLVFIGTDPDEWFEDRESVATMLASQASAGVKVEGGDVRAFSDGNVGWTADRGHFVLPDGARVPFRITCVFRREQDAWTLVQEHASVAVANEDAIGTEL